MAQTLTEKHFSDLILAIGLVDLDDRERKFLRWLSGWDQPTNEAALSLIRKLTRS